MANSSGNDGLLARVSVLEDQMERILGNGQPGLIDRLEIKVEEMGKTLANISRVVDASKLTLLVYVLVIIVAILSAGNGTVSLRNLIQWLTK
jgi:hypothetical protein